MGNKKKCQVIIVTHNNEKHMQWVMDGLNQSNSDIDIFILDSGSSDTSYLDNLIVKKPIKIKKEGNVGFVKGNNMQLDCIGEYEWTLFLNPDARIDGIDLDNLLRDLSADEYSNVGIVSIPLTRFDIDKKLSLGTVDSMGIKCNWYGKWYDIGSGEPVEIESKDKFISVEAVCGAFLLIRNRLLTEIKDRNGVIGFDSSYFMYKEDIELCQRISKHGFGVIVLNKYHAFHCRGWKKRSSIQHWAKKYSAINDLDLAFRYKKRALPYALIKYIWVNLFEK